MRRSNKLLGRVCHFETLETRTLLAGDVTASVMGGVLTITGNAASNSIKTTC